VLMRCQVRLERTVALLQIFCVRQALVCNLRGFMLGSQRCCLLLSLRSMPLVVVLGECLLKRRIRRLEGLDTHHQGAPLPF
jgi:hypothetical protein